MLRKVDSSSTSCNFLQILVLLLVLTLKFQLVSPQVSIQGLLSAIAKRSNAANKEKHGDEHEDETEFEVDQNLSESHKFALYKDFVGYHSLSVSSVSSKQATKVKRLRRTFAKIQLFAYSCNYLKRQLHNEKTSLPWRVKKKVTVTATSRSGSS